MVVSLTVAEQAVLSLHAGYFPMSFLSFADYFQN